MVERIKAPESAYEYLAKNNLIESIIKYVINWKEIRTSVYLKPWLKSQVTLALQDSAFIEFAKNNVPSYGTNKYDSIMIEILRLCKDRAGLLKYVTDQTSWRVGEYWQTYQQTWDLLKGDCEDGSVFMYVLSRVCGVPDNRLLLFPGYVQDPSNKDAEIGHCWLSYRPECDPINLVFLDWCYWPDTKGIYRRPSFHVLPEDIMVNGKEYKKNQIVGTDGRYKKMWWCFNESGTYLGFKPTATIL